MEKCKEKNYRKKIYLHCRLQNAACNNDYRVQTDILFNKHINNIRGSFVMISLLTRQKACKARYVMAINLLTSTELSQQ